ncbi:conserved hypothetical protein [Desulfamplus magnetovallimortis]|uniref:TOTE conflict system primase domain-containing protein n=1 Tax=Desulfamplus magnetovallimortis TaxID=1246637 RepID=A0A1W1HFB2_9BACT|nr:CRISPR-associated primase-polymerase type A1 [Desulfamplus magnetovallimortis]SLM31160.1 conserved hypothetical protein [Desulfamplus magnetovallimortis]
MSMSLQGAKKELFDLDIQGDISAKQPQRAESEGRTDTDYTLLLKRVQKAIDQADEMPQDIRNILEKSGLWQRLKPAQMLEWAKISQISGEISLAIDVFRFLTAKHPDFEQAWPPFLELLAILEKDDELAIQLKRAEGHLPEGLFNGLTKLVSAGESLPDKEFQDEKRDVAAAAPVETMNEKQALMAQFLQLFSGREDCFARQWADRQENKSGYVPVRYAMGISHLEEHLSGIKTYGIYLLKADSTVKCGVIDADIHPEYRDKKLSADHKRLLYREKNYMIRRIMDISAEQGIKPLLEYSGHKGYHFWFFFKSPVPASRVKSFLSNIAEPVNRDISAFDLEVFPKQDQLSGKGFGNLVKLPLGIHRKNGKPSFFMGCEKRDLQSQLSFLSNVNPALPEILDGVSSAGENFAQKNNQVVLHPRLAAFAKDYPELFNLERLCPPLGQVIATCRDGKDISAREEKVLFQSIGFLPRARYLVHYLMALGSEYNPHMVDFKLSRISGSPLGCRRIHSLLGFTSDYCAIEADSTGYLHPLIHLEAWKKVAEKKSPKSERIENLQDAIDNMKIAIVQLQRFLA